MNEFFRERSLQKNGTSQKSRTHQEFHIVEVKNTFVVMPKGSLPNVFIPRPNEPSPSHPRISTALQHGVKVKRKPESYCLIDTCVRSLM